MEESGKDRKKITDNWSQKDKQVRIKKKLYNSNETEPKILWNSFLRNLSPKEILHYKDA